MTTYKNILVDEKDGIVILTLNRPESLNALTPEMGDEITRLVVELNKDHKVRVLILTGAGRAFCSGGAKGSLQSSAKSGGRAEPPKSFYKRFLALRQLEIPTIAAINGYAFGAGLCIALACDMRIAATDARMGLNFVRLGIHPGMAGTYTTPRIIGMAKACEVIFTGKIYTGQEAFALGLVNRVTPAEYVLAESLSLASEIAANAPIAVRLAKRALYKDDADLLDAAIEIESQYQAHTWTTEDAKEGILAMTEKRSPKFRGV